MLDDKTDSNNLPTDENTDLDALLEDDDDFDDDEDYLPWEIKMGMVIGQVLFEKALKESGLDENIIITNRDMD